MANTQKVYALSRQLSRISRHLLEQNLNKQCDLRLKGRLRAEVPHFAKFTH